MTIQDSLNSAYGKTAIGNIATAFDIDPEKAQTAVRSLADSLDLRIVRNMLSRGGVADVVSLVTSPSAANTTLQPGTLASDATRESGNHVLDVLFGDKHISRGLASQAAKSSGLDQGTVERLLPVVANLFVGELQRQSLPAIAKIVRDVPGLGVSAGGSPLSLPDARTMGRGPSSYQDDDTAQNQPAPAPRQTPSARNGGPIDGGNPLPIPGDNIPGTGRGSRSAPQQEPDPQDEPENPYDRLPDIVRRGGTKVPGDQGGTLEDAIRNILGNLLGAGNRGVIGTIIQLFLVRFITSIVRSFLSRILGGRR